MITLVQPNQVYGYVEPSHIQTNLDTTYALLCSRKNKLPLIAK